MKRNTSVFTTIALFSCALYLISCSKTDITADPTVGLAKIGEGYATGSATKVTAYATQGNVATGYMKLYLLLTDSISGKIVEDAHVSLNPMMDMGMMKHTCPFENPASEKAVGHLFPCGVNFIMSSMGGTWTLGITVHNHANNKEGTLTLPLTVSDPSKATMKSFIDLSNSSNKYFIALLAPKSPKVGINDIELFIAKKASMMSFPADSSLTVTLTPEMPSMGHGSPNNVNPVHVGGGHYKGKVNFTMTGLWRLNLDFTNGSALADSTTYFDIEF